MAGLILFSLIVSVFVFCMIFFRVQQKKKDLENSLVKVPIEKNR